MISVIIPAYNAAETLPESLESVGRQSRPADEIIVVDDGSNDRTAEIAEGAGTVVLRMPTNRGAPYACNAGIDASRGELLAFLDADDLWAPDKLRVQEDLLMSQPEIDAVFAFCESFVCPSLDASAQNALRAKPNAPGWLTGAMLIRREAFLQQGPFDPRLRCGFFIDWLDRARRRGLPCRMLSNILLRRRLRPGTLSTRSNSRDHDLLSMAHQAILRRRHD